MARGWRRADKEFPRDGVPVIGWGRINDLPDFEAQEVFYSEWSRTWTTAGDRSYLAEITHWRDMPSEPKGWRGVRAEVAAALKAARV